MELMVYQSGALFSFFANNTVIQIITIAMHVTGQGLSEIAKLRWTTFRNIIVTRRKEERERCERTRHEGWLECDCC